MHLHISGIGTSSVYCDISLRDKGFPFECTTMKNETLVVKTHGAWDVKRLDKVVFIIRNPMMAFLSSAKYTNAGHTGNSSAKALSKGIHSH